MAKLGGQRLYWWQKGEGKGIINLKKKLVEIKRGKIKKNHYTENKINKNLSKYIVHI